MIKIKDLGQEDIGRWVEYTGGAGEKEIGKIKSWNDTFIFVVYKCNEEWDRFQDFTGAATSPEDLVFLSMCCKAQMVNGGVQCENCGSDGLEDERIVCACEDGGCKGKGIEGEVAGHVEDCGCTKCHHALGKL